MGENDQMKKINVILIGALSLFIMFNGASSLPLKQPNFVETVEFDTQSESILEEYESPNFVPGEIIVEFKSDTNIQLTKSERGHIQTGIESVDSLNAQYDVCKAEQVFPSVTKKENVHGLSDFYVFHLPEKSNIFSAIREFQQNPNVEYAGPNIIMTAQLIPNDPYYSSSGSWGQEFSDLYGLHNIHASEAWNITTGNDSIIVAVVDTGIDYNHEDLAQNMWINEDEIMGNGIDDDNDGFIDNLYGADIYYNDSDPMDGHGHGTHCAGTIAAVGNNALGVVGVNWQAKIMAVKSLSNSGSAGAATLAEGLVWAADNGADVISNSWGSDMPYPSEPTIEAAVRYAYDMGCVIVFAAGNSEDDVKYYCPSNMDEVITVAAVDHNDVKADFSNYGEKIDVSAPGVDILSLRADGTDFYGDGIHIINDTYYYASGTSMACPHVAGLAALLLAKNQSLSRDAIRTLIECTVDELDPPQYEWEVIGRGRINASRALQQSPAAIRLDSFVNPNDVKGIVSINGTAWGVNFGYYTVEYGRGQDPASWTILINSTTPIEDDVLASLDTTLLDEGFYSIKLQLVCGSDIYEKETWMIVNNEYNTIIVDDGGGPGVDFICIQDAVDDAGYEDSVYVHNGTYRESVTIRKTIDLTGENKYTTIIDGKGDYSVVYIYADQVDISGFTIQNSSNYGNGVRISYDITTSNYNTVSGNIITNNGNGIMVMSWSQRLTNNDIIGNDIIGNRFSGIYLSMTHRTTISDNTIKNNGDRGIILRTFSQFNTISDNVIANHYDGILLNEYYMDGANNYNTISKNTITNSTYGIHFSQSGPDFSSDNNTIFHNNFINNTYHAKDVYDNIWDDGYPSGGNYWSDYSGDDSYHGAEQTILGSDDIGDTPYNISGGSNQDNYPFMNENGWENLYCAADFDRDGDVDLSDFGKFAVCYSGANSPPPSQCECVGSPDPCNCDLDGDGDVDLSDFSIFALCFSGAGGTIPSSCPC